MIIGNGSLLFALTDSNEKLACIVKNNSPSTDMTNVLVTFTFPAGLEAANPQTNSPTAGAFDPVTGIWTVGTVSALTSETFDLEVLVTDSTQRPFTVTYVVTSDQSPDNVPSNDNAERVFDSELACEDFLNCTILSEKHGNILYVSTEGDNNTALKGDGHRPWRDPWTAAAAADNGDTVHVFPGIYTISDPAGGGDVEFTGSENLAFYNRTNTTTLTMAYELEPGVIIQSSVTDPTFALFDVDLAASGGTISVSGGGSIWQDRGFAFRIDTLGQFKTDIKLDTWLTDNVPNNRFMQSYFIGQTTISINHIDEEGPGFLEWFPDINQVQIPSQVTVNVNNWNMNLQGNISTDVLAGVDDSILRIFDHRSTGVDFIHPLSVTVNIDNLFSNWKGKGLLLHANPAVNSKYVSDLDITFNIGNWKHTDTQPVLSSAYVLDENLTNYLSGVPDDTSAVGAMLHVSDLGVTGTEMTNNSITVNVGNAEIQGMGFLTFIHENASSAEVNQVSYRANNHVQSVTPFITIGNADSGEASLTVSATVHVDNGRTIDVPFFFQNDIAGLPAPKYYISGKFECVGAAFGAFNDNIPVYLFTLKDILAVTDQTNILVPLVPAETSSMLIHSMASNKAAEAGLTELGQPIVVDANYI